jgi:hypothetical protein
VGGRKLCVLSIVSDNEMIGAASSSLAKDAGVKPPDIILQQRKDNGQIRVAINTRSNHASQLRAMAPILAAELRRLECLARKIDPSGRNLRFEGSSELVPWWFFLNHAGLVMIANGSESTPDVEPTKLCIEQIFLCVCDAWKQVNGATS